MHAIVQYRLFNDNPGFVENVLILIISTFELFLKLSPPITYMLSGLMKQKE